MPTGRGVRRGLSREERQVAPHRWPCFDAMTEIDFDEIRGLIRCTRGYEVPALLGRGRVGEVVDGEDRTNPSEGGSDASRQAGGHLPSQRVESRSR